MGFCDPNRALLASMDPDTKRPKRFLAFRSVWSSAWKVLASLYLWTCSEQNVKTSLCPPQLTQRSSSHPTWHHNLQYFNIFQHIHHIPIYIYSSTMFNKFQQWGHATGNSPQTQRGRSTAECHRRVQSGQSGQGSLCFTVLPVRPFEGHHETKLQKLADCLEFKCELLECCNALPTVCLQEA